MEICCSGGELVWGTEPEGGTDSGLYGDINIDSKVNVADGSVDERISDSFTPAASARRIECRKAVRKSGSKAWSINA